MEFQPMSPEEMQRTMQFLLSQQSVFDERLAKLSEKTDRIADGLIGLTGIVGLVARQIEETDKRLGAQITQQATEQGERMTQLQTHITVVIDMFERHLREDHGHRGT